MSDKNFLSKNAQYVDSLAGFILDTKPYHSKLTEIIEENQLFDDLNVKMEERMFIRTKTSGTWTYDFFSGGNSTFRTFNAQRVHLPIFTSSVSLRTGVEENTDLANVPYAYSKLSLDGENVSDAFVLRQGAGRIAEPLQEGHDYFLSHGSFEFRIEQTTTVPGGVYAPLWITTSDSGVISAARAAIIANAHDTTNPSSAVRRIQALMVQVQASLTTAGPGTGDEAVARSQAQVALIAINAILATPQLPSTYEPLLNPLELSGIAPFSPFTGWVGNDGEPVGARYLSDELSALSPSLYFADATDVATGNLTGRQSGALQYDEVAELFGSITSIAPNINATNYEQWTLECVSANAPALFSVFGSVSGFVGQVAVGSRFISSGIEFNVGDGVPLTVNDADGNPVVVTPARLPVLGDRLNLVPRNVVVIHPSASLETWNIIKVNPLSYSRPVLTSTRYGYIRDISGNVGQVSILAADLIAGTYTLTARADARFFDLRSSADPLYTGVAQVGVLFNDGKFAFTIVAGSVYPFAQGDRFYIEIDNPPATVEELQLGYGYDLDSLDNPDLVYNNTVPGSPLFNTRINFLYDTRFLDYDLGAMGVALTQLATDGRTWRATAQPDFSQPLATQKRSGVVDNAVDIADADVGQATFFDMVNNIGPEGLHSSNDPDLIPDLRLYLADRFKIEWSDDGATWTTVGFIPVGGTFSSPVDGVSFSIPTGTKPFIGAQLNSSWYADWFATTFNTESMVGGDVFSFTVRNPGPQIVEKPIGLAGAASPRLIMRGDGFHEAPAANWAVTMTGSTTYTVTALNTVNNPGTAVAGSPIFGRLTTAGVNTREGHSFNALGVHFTIVPGRAGLASGDRFTFSTYEEKPTYLVHGSGSGWSGEATVGTWFWNGKIGFMLDAPEADAWSGSAYQVPSSLNGWFGDTLKLDRIRQDCPSLAYTLVPTTNGAMVTRSDVNVVGFLPLPGSFKDQYATITCTASTLPASSLRININDHGLPLFTGHDLVILRPRSQARLPIIGDSVRIEKTRFGDIGLTVNTQDADLAPLAPITIDQRFIDTNTNLGGVPLAVTSPETAFLTGWLPLTFRRRDSAVSTAEFNDPAIYHDLYSAASGQLVGTLRPEGTDITSPTTFEWDQTFFESFLPLNAETHLVTYNPGMIDVASVSTSESLRFLVSGGGLDEDALFNDDANVSAVPSNMFYIGMTQTGNIDVTATDGPFTGFMPGYDNTNFDDEGGPIIDQYVDGVAQGTGPANYDLGSPSSIDSLLANPNLTAQQRQDILDLWNNFLGGGGEPGTSGSLTWEAFWTNIVTDPTQWDLTTSAGFGRPLNGLGLSIGQSPTTVASTAFSEDFQAVGKEHGTAFGSQGFGLGELDAPEITTAIFRPSGVPPIPATIPGGTTYNTLQGAFEIDVPVDQVEVTFTSDPTSPIFRLWTTALDNQPVISTNLGNFKYRFSVPRIVGLKVTIS